MAYQPVRQRQRGDHLDSSARVSIGQGNNSKHFDTIWPRNVNHNVIDGGFEDGGPVEG